MPKSDAQIALQYVVSHFADEWIFHTDTILAALAAARADERGNSRGGTHCACSFDENDKQLHQCDEHRDQIVQARAEQHAECVRLLMERGQYAAASWLDSHKP